MTSKHKIFEVHIPSVIGYEKVAMDSAAAVASLMGFHESRIQDLKTAVSEACTNAMEHGNRLQQATKVLVTLKMSRKSLEVNVKDHGSGLRGQTRTPEIEKKVEGAEDPRGWGMFLIKSLVDEVEFRNVPEGGNEMRMVIHLNR